jgi:hypothetical protein
LNHPNHERRLNRSSQSWAARPCIRRSLSRIP